MIQRVVDSPYSLDVVATSVKVNKTYVSMKTFQSIQLSATISPTNVTSNSVKWTSSNAKTATVSTNGLVTAKAPGTVTITATTVSGSKKATCKITVIQSVKSIKLNKTALTILIGKTYKLIPIISPYNASNNKVVWKTSNTKIAIVRSNGIIKGINKGIAYIYVITLDGKKTSKCKVIVK